MTEFPDYFVPRYAVPFRKSPKKSYSKSNNKEAENLSSIERPDRLGLESPVPYDASSFLDVSMDYATSPLRFSPPSEGPPSRSRPY